MLDAVLPPAASVLEIASGSGLHAAHVAVSRPRWTWQPSDRDDGALAAIAARTAGLANVLAPVRLDVLDEPWPAALARTYDAVFAANVLHISEEATGPALMAGAAERLPRGGVLAVYGPFIVDGEPLAPSNAAFDADLRARDPRWGLRTLSRVAAAAERAGLALERTVRMPANNLTLVFRSSVSTSRGAGAPRA